jgi:hypothetical protein
MWLQMVNNVQKENVQFYSVENVYKENKTVISAPSAKINKNL